MKLSELLAPELIRVPFRAVDKWMAISALAATAVEAGALPPALRERAAQALESRERSMTTGLEQGIAIPHAAIDGIEDVIGVLGIAADGIPFESLDGEPAKLVVGLIIPRSKKLLHIKTLAEIARLLGREQARVRLLACEDPAMALDVVRELEAGG